MDTTTADMPQRRTFSGRWVAIAAGIVALVAFFFPWINYQDRAYSGFEFAQAMGGVTKGFDVTLYAIPVLAIMVIAFAFVSMRNESEGGTTLNNWTILAAVSGLCISAGFLLEQLLGGWKSLWSLLTQLPGAPESLLSGEKATGILETGTFTGFGVGIYASIIMFGIAAIAGALEWRRPAARARAAWRTQDFVLLAVLATALGALYLIWLQAWIWAAVLTFGVGAQVGQELFFGLWLVAGPLGAYIVRRPGAAFLAESLAALVEVLMGAPAGPILVVTGIMQAVGAELVFALTRYRSWGWGTMLAAGAATAIVAIPWNWFRLGYFALSPGFLILLLIVRIFSGGLAGAAAKVIGDLLARTGALNFFPIGRERMEEV